MSKPEIKSTAGQKMVLIVSSGQSLPHPPCGWEGYLTGAYHCLRLALAGVFIYAGFIKLLDPRAFAHAIAQYDLVPEALLPAVAIGLPVLELLAGLGLMLEIRGSLTTTAILLLMFLVILGYAVWHNLDIDCGCFTAEDLEGVQSVKIAIWRDLLMVGATLFLYRRQRSRPPQSRWINQLTIRLKGESR